MRHGRSKAARKTLQFFARTQGFKPPYHILLDGTFLVAVVKFKFPLRERLDKVLQHAYFTLYTTESCLEELKKLKEANEDKKDLLGETIAWARNECDVLDTIPEFEKSTKNMMDSKFPQIDQTLSPAGFDILKLALHSSASPSSSTGNSKTATKYFVACQDETVLDVLRNSGTVPCIRLARGSVLLLENPSKSGQIQDSHAEKKKWAASGSVREEERKLVNIVKEEQRSQKQQPRGPAQQQRKKRKAKEPNPLSCKKSKDSDQADSGKKRRRKRKSGSAEE